MTSGRWPPNFRIEEQKRKVLFHMVAILLGTGFEESEALVPADLLRRAGVEVRLVGVDGPAVTSAHGVTVTADLTLAELDREAVDMLVLPGGLGAWRCSRATATYRP